MDPRTSVMAFYVGGPLDETREPVSLINGHPPLERHCAKPLPPIGPEIPSDEETMLPPTIGVYYFKGGTHALDFEGLPGDKRWVEANYEWQGWR